MHKRNLNIELIRIVSMLLIVYHHFSVHTNWNFPEETGMRKYLILTVGNYGKGGVILFVLITGYFFSRQKFSFSKITQLNNTITFYTMSFFFISLFWLSFNWKTLLMSAFPLIFDQYWFVTNYLFLLLFQPIISVYMRQTKREDKLKYFLALLTFFYLPTVAGFIFQIGRHFTPNSYLVFLLAALLGDLIREYEKELKTTFYKYVLFGFSLSVLLLQTRHLIINFLDKHHWSYPNFMINETKSLNIILFSFSLFIILLKVKISSKISTLILFMSSVTFEIYLIHDNPLFRPFLWNQLLKNPDKYWSNSLFFIVILQPLVIFVICVLIAKLRIGIRNKLFVKKKKQRVK